MNLLFPESKTELAKLEIPADVLQLRLWCLERARNHWNDKPETTVAAAKMLYDFCVAAEPPK